MKTLQAIESHGSQMGKHTGYQTWPGFVLLKFTDGTQRHLGDISINEAIRIAETSFDVDCAEFKRNFEAGLKATRYPEKPEGAELYLHNYGYEKPVELGEWDWSSTFGRWGRTVTFADGWRGFTYPKQ